jgi:hypothetical protein
MAGLVPAIHVFHVFALTHRSKTWMPGPRPGMTVTAAILRRAGARLEIVQSLPLPQNRRDAGEHGGEFTRVDAIGRHGELHHGIGKDVGEREFLLRSIHLFSPCERGCESERWHYASAG